MKTIPPLLPIACNSASVTWYRCWFLKDWTVLTLFFAPAPCCMLNWNPVCVNLRLLGCLGPGVRRGLVGRGVLRGLEGAIHQDASSSREQGETTPASTGGSQTCRGLTGVSDAHAAGWRAEVEGPGRCKGYCLFQRPSSNATFLTRTATKEASGSAGGFGGRGGVRR